MTNNTSMNVLGLMSGTSLDGLDIAFCKFSSANSGLSYELVKAETIPYSSELRNRLAKAHLLSAEEFWLLHCEFGRYLGEQAKSFLTRFNLKADAISSHGHTVFHQPEKGFTSQIGDGAALAVYSGLRTVCDFRSTDVALGGQGAPLVPKGELDLFPNQEAFLNLGGIANVSLLNKNPIKALDVCPFNQVLNFFAAQKNLNFDKDGELASKGLVHQPLLNEWNKLSFYQTTEARSLGREWVHDVFLPVVNQYELSVETKLATAAEHFAFQIVNVLKSNNVKNCMVTGGGAYNADFIRRMKAISAVEWHIPNDETIQFKEALVFAYLGYLRLNLHLNVIKSVTGASHNSCSGAIYESIR